MTLIKEEGELLTDPKSKTQHFDPVSEKILEKGQFQVVGVID